MQENKRIYIQQKIETLDLFYKQFIQKDLTIFPLRKPDPRYITWGLIRDPFYKEPKERIDISEMYTTWIVHRMNKELTVKIIGQSF